MAFYPPAITFFFTLIGLTEGLFGVKVRGAQMIIRRNDEILLIKTTYRKHWEFPGGRVDKGETGEEAAIREAREESAVNVKNTERKLGSYLQRNLGRKIIVEVFVAREWDFEGEWSPSLEIADRKFFPLNALPPDISPATARRIAELLAHTEEELSGAW